VLVETHGDIVDFLGTHLPGLGALADRFLSADDGPADWAREPGYFPLGLPELRRAIARHLSRGGLPTAEDQVLVTSGAQQAIGLVAALFLRRGDEVALEDPTYLGAIDIFQEVGARLIPIPVGNDGLRLDALRETLGTDRPRLIYAMPTFQNPTGAVLPESGRRRLARLCEERGIPLVEDNTLAELALDGEPPPPVAAFAAKAPILTIGSLSKLVWAGLRIGWVRAAEPVIARLAPRKTIGDLGSSVPSQVAALKFFRDAERIRALRRREIAERRARLLRELERQLPAWTYTRPAGGLSVWVRLPHGSAAEFARVALQYGVSVLPGTVTSPTGRFTDHLRLPFVLEGSAIREGVDRLARAWRAYAPASRPEGPRLGVLV
jgi:DNA-binding transcriptional MocR family regulator